MVRVDIWTDGSCRNATHTNGGYGVVMVFNRKGNSHHYCHSFYGGSFYNTTSSRMEIRAVVEALRRCKPEYKVTINSDSEYVVNTINKGWLSNWIEQGILHEKQNKDLWGEIADLIAPYPKDMITFKWLKGHAGNPHNEKADRLAALGAKSTEISIDDFHPVKQK